MKPLLFAAVAGALGALAVPAVIFAPSVVAAYESKQTWGYVFYTSYRTENVPGWGGGYDIRFLERRAWHSGVLDLGKVDRGYAGGFLTSKLCVEVRKDVAGTTFPVNNCGGYYFKGFDSPAEAQAALDRDLREFLGTDSPIPTKIRVVPLPALRSGERAPGIITLSPPRGPAAGDRGPSTAVSPSAEEQAAAAAQARRAAEAAEQQAGTDAANAAVVSRDRAIVARNAKARADFEARRRAHEREVAEAAARRRKYEQDVAAAEARRRKYESDMAKWRADACKAGDRSKC